MQRNTTAHRLFTYVLIIILISTVYLLNSTALPTQAKSTIGQDVNSIDAAGITVVTTPPMQTTESGGTAGFTVVLDSQPADIVTITLNSNDVTEGTVTSPAVPLTFTTGNWDTPKPVTVTGENDDVDDGNIPYKIILDPSSTGDTDYNSLPNVEVDVTNIDDDTAGVTVVTNPPMQTTESGGTAGFTVVLDSQPTDTVTITLNSNDPNEGIVISPVVPLSFTTINWDTPQPVTVLGVDDDVVDGDIAYDIILTPASTGDTNYDNLAEVNVGVTNLNEDVAGFNITPVSGLLTSENGIPTASFDVTLKTIPTGDVSLLLSSSDSSEGTIDKTFLTFTSLTWNIIQTVTITGVDDFVKDDDQVYVIVTGPVSTTDTDYGALDPISDIPDVSVTNSDNDTAGYTITPTTDLWTSEGGASVKVQVLLKSRPTDPVLLSVSSNKEYEGTVSIENEYINPAFWPQSIPTEITITGIDDCVNNGDENYEVSINATSIDPLYNGPVEGSPLAVINYDAPTIAWVEPVGDEGIYVSDGFNPINLGVINLCNEPISRVRFNRWVVAIHDHVTIGEVLTSPYQEVLDSSVLESGYNQIFAFAFGPVTPNQTVSEHKRILILNDFNFRIQLPLVYKNY